MLFANHCAVWIHLKIMSAQLSSEAVRDPMLHIEHGMFVQSVARLSPGSAISPANQRALVGDADLRVVP